MNENNQNNNEISSEVEKNSTLRVTSPHWSGFKRKRVLIFEFAKTGRLLFEEAFQQVLLSSPILTYPHSEDT